MVNNRIENIMVKNIRGNMLAKNMIENIMIKNMRKNIMTINSRLIYIPDPHPFCSYSRYQTPTSLKDSVLKKELKKRIQDIDNNSSKEDIVQKEIVDLIEAKKDIKSDIEKVVEATKAIEKISNNETPKKTEFSAYSYIRDQYSEFFNIDLNSDSESEAQESKQDETENLANLKDYLSSEFTASTSELKKLKKDFSELSVKDSTDVSVQGETTKRKFEESGEEGPSKKSNQGVHDFVENLPTDYNPLDDVSSD